MYLFKHVLRPTAGATPGDGVLAAEAACQIGQYMFNFMAHAEGVISMKPLRCIPDPPRKRFAYEASTNKIVTTPMDGKSVWMPSGWGSEAVPEGHVLRKLSGLGLGKGLPASSTGSRLKRKPQSGSITGALISRPRRGTT